MCFRNTEIEFLCYNLREISQVSEKVLHFQETILFVDLVNNFVQNYLYFNRT